MKQTETPFYIGWQDEMPPRTGRLIRRVLLGLILLAVLAAGLAVWSQQGFDAARFELGRQTTLTGVLVYKPVPMLRLTLGHDPAGRPVWQHVLLIGLGKYGAAQTLAAMEAHADTSLAGRQVRLRGTRIYYEGKAALELTNGAAALLDHVAASSADTLRYEALGEVRLRGELVDPKCKLGVMRPGEGRVHRDCAVRCLSGGIPAMLYTSSETGQSTYCLVLGPAGEPVQPALLDYVGGAVQLAGTMYRYADWLVLYTDPAAGVARLGTPGYSQLSACR
ncbi:MAG: hypothetical protein OHK0039_20670 [Bacteroidia bacterium]